MPSVFALPPRINSALNAVPYLSSANRLASINDVLVYGDYVQRVRQALGLNRIAHWTLNDHSGTTALDDSGGSLNGTYLNATLNAVGQFDRSAVLFAGTGSISIYSAGLGAVFDPNLGSMTCWIKPTAWATNGFLWSIGPNIQNRINCQLSSGAIAAALIAGNDNSAQINGPLLGNHLEWVPVTVSWNKASNRLRLYVFGAQLEGDIAMPGTWVGALGATWTALAAMLPDGTGGLSGWVHDYILTNNEPTVEQIGALHGFTSARYILPVGDSKTVGSNGDGEKLYGYPARMNQGSVQFIESPTRIAAGGVSADDVRSTIDASLAAATGTPDYIFINLGVNDDPGVSESDFKSDYEYIIAALHTKYPLAQMRLMQVWQTAYNRDAMDTWIAEMAAAHSYTALWGDERTFLPDTNLDGTHPTVRGYQFMADLARQSIGL